MSGCPSCRNRLGLDPARRTSLGAFLERYSDPAWCRAEAARLLAEADRRDRLPFRGLPEGSWSRAVLEAEEAEGRTPLEGSGAVQGSQFVVTSSDVGEPEDGVALSEEDAP